MKSWGELADLECVGSADLFGGVRLNIASLVTRYYCNHLVVDIFVWMSAAEPAHETLYIHYFLDAFQKKKGCSTPFLE